jgi:hypothetical protein
MDEVNKLIKRVDNARKSYEKLRNDILNDPDISDETKNEIRMMRERLEKEFLEETNNTQK